jgi:hypothetical protein
MSNINELTFESKFGLLDEDMPLEAARKRYACLLTDRERKSFDDVDKDAFINTEKYFISLKRSDDAVRTEMIRHWVNFFLLNEDYEDYCIAKRNMDEVEIVRLEQEFPASEHKGIARLYEDWGDIHSDDWSFDGWLEEHRKLFSPPSKNLTPVNQGDSSITEGHVLVSMPKGINDKQELWTLFSQFCNKHYFPEHAEYIPAYTINGRPSITLLQKLEMAAMVDEFFQYHDDEQEKKRDQVYSNSQVVMSIMTNPLLRYRYGVGDIWKDGAVAIEVLIQNDELLLSVPALANKRPGIIELKKFFDESVRQTIYGTFPA